MKNFHLQRWIKIRNACGITLFLFLTAFVTTWALYAINYSQHGIWINFQWVFMHFNWYAILVISATIGGVIEIGSR